MTRLRMTGTFQRPVLAPGLRAFARSPGEIQIGLTRGHRVRLPDSPALQRVLGVLNRGEAPRDAPSTRRVLADLAPVLRDGDALVHPGIAPADVAVTTLRHPVDCRERLLRRSRTRVQVLGDLGLTPEVDLGGLLRRCGLGVDDAGAGRPSVVVLLVRGEPDRATLDPLLRHGVPHLLVRAVESELVVGPFVVPERTACVRCVDAHQVEGEVLEEYLRSARHDGVAEPLDSASATVALGWVVADLIRFAEGDRPASWSTTITLGTGAGEVIRTSWLRHPSCGCSWGGPALADPSVTMAV